MPTTLATELNSSLATLIGTLSLPGDDHRLVPCMTDPLGAVGDGEKSVDILDFIIMLV